MDMFESQVQVEVEKRLRDIVQKDPRMVIDAYAIENKRLINIVVQKDRELEISNGKALQWSKFLDSDGHLDVSEVAERIRIPYIDPSGKRKLMGLHYFCKLLTKDKILLEKATGYGLYSDCSTILKNNSKIVSSEKNGFIRSSVKFNAVALEWLDEKYSNDTRVWHSTSSKEIYFD